jgi:phosphatidylglycerophosphate synthase
MSMIRGLDSNTAILTFIFFAGFVAQEASRAYQRRKHGFIDEEVAKGWRRRIMYFALSWLLILALYHLWIAADSKRCAVNHPETWSICAQ